MQSADVWVNGTKKIRHEGGYTPFTIDVTEDVMFKWRLLVEDGRKVGHPFSQPDLIIAATALHHGLTCASICSAAPVSSVTRTMSPSMAMTARAASRHHQLLTFCSWFVRMLLVVEQGDRSWTIVSATSENKSED